MINTKISINRFVFVNYLAMLIITCGYIGKFFQCDMSIIIFNIAALLSYAFVYLIPAGLILALCKLVLKVFGISEKLFSKLLLYTIAVLAFTLTHLVILVDRVIFKMYGFHFNGFVWNIFSTKGGIESMGFDHSAYWTAAAMALGAIVVEIFLLIMCIRWDRFRISHFSKIPHYLRITMPYAAVFMFVVQGVFFGVSSFKGNSGVLAASNTFPFFMPITFQGLLTDMGLKSNRNPILTADQLENKVIQYPLAEIKQRPDSPHYNIVWLVAESWRADMLSEEVMPQTWKFAQKAQCFTNHFSGGNGTRKALFSMFYGLYGNYWSKFLNEQRSPVIMDLLQQDNYQIDLYTSARFTYPEFDKTLFSRIPAEHLHEHASDQGWKSDRVNVSQMLDFISSRDTSKPFMTFLFFESPHARYYFPPECEIRKNYLKEFNYATVDIQKDIGLIFNRYVNSCNHLDTQFARVIDYLENEGLLDNTIVIITGDHGEEFMEHGRWGHNSAFVKEQIKTPLVIWVPGKEPKVYTKMTSHLDIPATIMHVLGVESPAKDYSLGIDLFSEEKRQYTVVSDWDSLAYIDSDCKIILPLKASAMLDNEMTTCDDKMIPNSSTVYSQKVGKLVQVLHESTEFTQRN